MIDRLNLIVMALNRRFPEGVDPFKMVSRLAEECGELAAEVHHWEGQGRKREKHGDPDPQKTVKEVMDVLTSAIAIAQHYDLLDELSARIDLSIERARDDGFLSSVEVAAARP